MTPATPGAGSGRRRLAWEQLDLLEYLRELQELVDVDERSSTALCSGDRPVTDPPTHPREGS